MKKSILKPISIILTCGLVSFTAACDIDKEDEEESENSDSTSTVFGGGSSGGSSTTVDSLDDLKLSSSLKFDLPAALSGDDGSSLALTNSKKSMEACEVGRVVKEGLQSLESIASTMCHLEAESESIKFGVKYSVVIENDYEESEDDGDLRIWVDNSVTGQLTISMCRGDDLNEVFTITDVGEGAAGVLINRGSWEDHTYARSIKFDFGATEAGRAFLTAADSFSNDNGEEFKRSLLLDLNDSGVSKIRVSNAGTWEGSTFAHAGAANIGADYGQVLFSNSGTFEEQSFEWTHRSFFDNNGYVVAPDASDAFAEGGALFVADEEVPKFLGDDFAVTAFAADAWDCSFDEEISIDMSGDTGAAHQACDSGRDDDHEGVDCWSDAYEQSDEEHDIDESAQKEHDEMDDLSEIE